MTKRRLTPNEAVHYSSLALTYSEVGATGGVLPSGYRHIHAARVVSSAVSDLDGLADFLFTWRMHEHAGFAVAASRERAEVGSDVVLCRRFGPITVRPACRVVSVVDESEQRGFAYGTLPGHPERGEESFMLQAVAKTGVVATVTAFSRPATSLSRAAGPMGRRMQDVMTRRYLDVLADSVNL